MVARSKGRERGILRNLLGEPSFLADARQSIAAQDQRLRVLCSVHALRSISTGARHARAPAGCGALSLANEGSGSGQIAKEVRQRTAIYRFPPVPERGLQTRAGAEGPQIPYNYDAMLLRLGVPFFVGTLPGPRRPNLDDLFRLDYLQNSDDFGNYRKLRRNPIIGIVKHDCSGARWLLSTSEQ